MSRPFGGGGLLNGSSYRSSKANMLVNNMVKDDEIGMMDADGDHDNFDSNQQIQYSIFDKILNELKDNLTNQER